MRSVVSTLLLFSLPSILVFGFTAPWAAAQCVAPSTPQWIENFDDYVLPPSVNSIALANAPENNGVLETFGFLALVVNQQFDGADVPVPHTGGNVVYLRADGNSSGVRRRHCDVQQNDLVGERILSRAYLYFPGKSTGDFYYIELSDYDPGGEKTWAHQTHFGDDGTIEEDIHGIATGAYDFDQWIEITVEHNLDDNEQQLLLNGEPLASSPFPWTPNPETGVNLEATEFFSLTHSGYFVDTLETRVFTPIVSEGIRGDFDADGSFEGLADGLGLLGFFFSGTPGPPCEETADADGNGALNGLVDGLAILNVAFNPGIPPLPAPFPDCGELTDLLSCANPPGCP